jgi:uncharacterized DUF497 family protein
MDVLFSAIHLHASEEHCIVTVGLLGEEFVAVVWTARKFAIRLISLRRARDAEKRIYRERFS